MAVTAEAKLNSANRVSRAPVPPAELRALPQWVLWRWEVREGRPTKVPCSARTGRRIDVREPQGWTTYAAARRALGRSRGRYAGIGFVFTPFDPFCGIDLDNALEKPGGKLLPWARAIVERLATYAELSPSGRGVKLFLRGCLPRDSGVDGWNNRVRHVRRGLGDDGRGSAELYDERRFFTVTARRWADGPAVAKVAERQAELTALYRELFPPPRPRPQPPAHVALADDETILERAMAAANGAKLARLWAGDASEYGGDESSRDAALCACLAFYTRDPKQIERLVFRSGCSRPKWEQRPDYRERTIQFALANVTNCCRL